MTARCTSSSSITVTHVVSAAVLHTLLPEQGLGVRLRVRGPLDGVGGIGEAGQHGLLLDALHPVWIGVLVEERVDRHYSCGGEPGGYRV